MHILRLAFSLIAIGLILQSCAGTRLDLDSTRFLTRISDSGLKHFELVVKGRQDTAEEVEQRPKNRQQANMQRKREKRVDPEKIQKKLEATAREHIAQNQYCRSGFWVMKTNSYGQRPSLRGECHDPANDRDRQTFPDTIKEW